MGKKMRKSRVDGSKLRMYREDAAFSIEELAGETVKRAAAEKKKPISEKTIWRIEHGSGAQPYTISRLADALGIEPKDLLKEDEPSSTALSENLYSFEDFIEDRTKNFVGRKFVFDAIDEFLRNHDSGYFFVRGDPGIGKSSIAAQLVKERECIHHFNIRSEGINKANIFLNSICSQLIIDYELEYSLLPPEAPEDGRFLNKLLKEVSSKLNNKEKAIIVIDALDEVDTNSFQSGANMLYLPCDLPKGVFIIATTRKQPINMRIECAQDKFDIEHDSDQNLDDIQEYLKHKIKDKGILSYIKKQKFNKQSFVKHMKKKSQGNFMYLCYVLPEIENGAYKDLGLERLPTGLENYYKDHWCRMGMMTKPLPKEKIKIVYILSEAVEPVSRVLLVNFSKEDAMTVQNVIDGWNQFLHKQEINNQMRFSVYHDSFRGFLSKQEIVQAAEVSIEGINRIIGDNLYEDLYGDE